MNTTAVFCMYGLGGPLWSGGMEFVLAESIRKLPNVICPPTRRFTEWTSIVEAIKALPESNKVVVIGHSLGAAAGTWVTDYVPVDLLILYDLAGATPSKLGKNTGRCIDIYDTVPDLVPEWRVQAVKGHEHKIERWFSQYGHTGQDDSLQLADKVVGEVKALTEKDN